MLRRIVMASNAAPHAAPHNKLAAATSPYLLQHKANPVDWWPWSPEALAAAKATNKPILLSVGYAACHWCHVMAHESFEDKATAAVMNELFVSIKVDREERPDIDQIYMNALHLLGEQGGWPLTMFLNSDGEPFWGGTYFPKDARYGKPAFVDVLREVSRVYHQEPQSVAQNRDALLARLRERGEAESPGAIGVSQLNDMATSLARATDPVHGGLRGAPKFPQGAMLEYLWRAGVRMKDARFFDVVDLALTKMSEGGIYDHLGGGYSRYSVDERWLVPHFEKMLYDNAQLLELLALAFARAPKALFAQRAEETVGWLIREMTVGEGAFASSLDADSEGEEGKFYVWSQAEVERVLGTQNAALFGRVYDVTAEGNFEGQNILNRLNPLQGINASETTLGPLRFMLHQERSKRVRPGLDDKVLADWNGLMIAALVQGAVTFDRPDWLALAGKAFGFVASAMAPDAEGDPRLGHSWREGKLLVPGLASDYAAMIRAAIALFEATQQRSYLDHALAWQAALDRHHADGASGAYLLTADDAEGLIVRPHSTVDDAIPNHNGLIAQNLLRLSALAGIDRLRTGADALLSEILPKASKNAFGHLSLLNAFDMRLNLAEIFIAGDDSKSDELFQAALKLPYATRVIIRAANSSQLPKNHPARKKIAATKTDAAFVCRGETCSLPVTDIEQLKKLAS
jgi:uncharacterized protein YyaL (SSP411 family)